MEDFSSPDQRSQFEVFESILKKLHQKYSREEYELLCKSCNMDLAVPQISSNGVYLGNNFIRLLMKKYKRNNELSYGNDQNFLQLLGDLGYSKNEIYSLFTKDDEIGAGIEPKIVNQAEAKIVDQAWKANFSGQQQATQRPR